MVNTLDLKKNENSLWYQSQLEYMVSIKGFLPRLGHNKGGVKIDQKQLVHYWVNKSKGIFF